MSVHDDLTSVQRCLDDLARSVGRLEQQMGGGLEMRRVRTDADHLRESVALLREAAPGLGHPPAPRPRVHPRHPVRQHPVDGLGRRGTRRPRPPRPLNRPSDRASPTGVMVGHWYGTPSRTAAAYATGTRAAIAAPHLRTDRWWLAPAATAAGLLAFIVYSTWRAFANADYYAAPYVSPFYSPCLAEQLRADARAARTRTSSAAGGASPPRCSS